MLGRNKQIDSRRLFVPHGYRTHRLVIAIAALVVLVVVPLATAAGKTKKLHLTALVKKDVPGKASAASQGEKIVLSLNEGKKVVGSARFPGCEGTGTSFICGGTVSLDDLGTNLATLITFECPPEPPFTCKPGIGSLATKSNVVKGTITLKVQPEKIKAGAKFPVIVAEATGK
jgi:hypothetical protein